MKGRGQLPATSHSLDIEYAYTLMSIAKEMGMQVAISSIPLARLLERIQDLPSKHQILDEYVSYPAPFEATSIEKHKREDANLGFLQRNGRTDKRPRPNSKPFRRLLGNNF